MVDPKKRQLLKAGMFFLPSAGWLTCTNGYATQHLTLLPMLSRHRWLSAAPKARPGIDQLPPIASGVNPATNSTLLFWVRTDLTLVKKYRLNPLRAARALSYLMVAMHDAVLSSLAVYNGSTAHASVAIHLTAAHVIEYLFPEEIKGRWIGKSIVFASGYTSVVNADWVDLWRMSQDIAHRAIERAMVDGSARINSLAQPPNSIALPWKSAPPLWSTRPVEPGAASWKNWLVPSAIGDQCPPPLTLDSASYSREILEVYQTHQNLSARQKSIAEEWNLELGTVTPPGVWLLKAVENSAFQNLTLIEQTGTLSMLTTTMLDAFTACWHTKFKWWTERPITAIRRVYDPAFLPHVLTPSFPSYTSGHATVSGAAATILSSIFPQYRDEWMKSAQEAADSRLYGGIHFRFDNEEGLALGKKVAAVAISKVTQGKAG